MPRTVLSSSLPHAPTGDDAEAIAAENVSFTYGEGTEALGGVSLKVNHGEVLGIVGPSGCGKSTFLKLVAGLDRPTEGQLAVSSRRKLKDRHGTAMVFQNDTLLPWSTVIDNVRLFARFRGRRWRAGNRRDLATRVERLLKLGRLEGFEDAYPAQLSGGMRRRVAFLAAVAPHPALLLLDEPFSSVDEPTRVGIHQDVFQIMNELSITGIVVTHDIAEAISLCDRVALFTRRPGSIATMYDVPFGHERNIPELRESAAFLNLYGEIWHDLRSQI